MKRLYLLFLFLLLVGHGAWAQFWQSKRLEATAGLGPTFFFGDVGGFSNGTNALGFKDFTFLQTRADFDVSLKYRLKEDINIRLSLSGGQFNATDRRGSNNWRELQSSTEFFRPAVMGEYYLVKNRIEGSYMFQRKGQRMAVGFKDAIDFYVFAGIGGMSYSVEANAALEERVKDFDSDGFAVVVPVGAGTKYVYSQRFDFGAELCGHYIFSDNIDGYTSQYSKHNDVYYSLNFFVVCKINTGGR
ncbi:MAG: DUF6089 family protein [Bacteroidales bacterium]|jgi:hypothetical protein|nr:DUF6089 family protein [Bacteroidales bacterium]